MKKCSICEKEQKPDDYNIIRCYICGRIICYSCCKKADIPNTAYDDVVCNKCLEIDPLKYHDKIIKKLNKIDDLYFEWKQESLNQ